MKVGDKFRVKHPNKDDTCWVGPMDKYIGKVLTIKSIYGHEKAFEVEETDWDFPIECIDEIIAEERTPWDREYDAKPSVKLKSGDKVLIRRPEINNTGIRFRDRYHNTMVVVDDTYEEGRFDNVEADDFHESWATKVTNEDIDFLVVLSKLSREVKLNMIEFIKNNVDNQEQADNH